MSVQVQVETLEHNMAKLTVTVPAETFEKGITQAYLKMRSQISVPGFRKGKVPQHMVEKMYGPEMFYEEATNIILPGTYDEAVLEVKDIKIASQPKIELVQIGKGKEFIYTAEVAVMPEATLGQYKGFEIEQEEVVVSDEDIAEQIKKVQNQNARVVGVERAAKDGDIVLIDYSGTIDGGAFDGGAAEDHELTLGSNMFIPGFEEKLVGAVAGEERDLDLVFPDDYFSTEVAGKQVLFHVKVKEVKEKQLPIIDDEFAQDVSEFDTLDEYKEDIKKRLEEEKKEAAHKDSQQKAVDKVLEGAEIDVPDAMVETQAKDMVDRYARQLQSNGLGLDVYLNIMGMSLEEFIEQMKPQALKNIKSRIALKAVAKAENIEASKEEVDEELGKLATQYGVSVDQLRDLLPAEEVEMIEDDTIAQKAIDFVLESSTIIPVAKADKEDEGEAAGEPEA